MCPSRRCWSRFFLNKKTSQFTRQLHKSIYLSPTMVAGPIGFVSKFTAILWYVCVQNSNVEPDQAKRRQGGTPQPTNESKLCTRGPATSCILARRCTEFCLLLCLACCMYHPIWTDQHCPYLLSATCLF